MKALLTMTKTDIKLSFREFSGVIFGIMIPVGLMILLGVIYGSKLAFEGASYTLVQQSFPAIITVGIVASGLMGIPIVISDYREKKILKRIKVTPTKPITILVAQSISWFVVSLISSVLVWLAAKLFFGYSMIGSFFMFALYYVLTLASIFSLGFMIASVAKNVKTSNLLCNLFYFPMFFLSGATVPYEILPRGLQIFSNIMPLTHGIKLLKASSLNILLENGAISILYLCVLTIGCIIVSVKTFRWE